MRTLLTTLLTIGMLYTASAQSIIAPRGKGTLNLNDIKSGQIVSYNFHQQGALVFRSISIDGIRAFKFGRNVTVDFGDGRVVTKVKNFKSLAMALFLQNGFSKLEETRDKSSASYNAYTGTSQGVNSLTTELFFIKN